jgi:hypothetical protein
VFAHCNRIDSLEGIVCSLYGIIQEQSSCFCLCVSTSSGHKTEHLPEAICEFNVLEPSSVSAGTQYNYSDFLGKDDHTWTDNQTTFTHTKILCMDEKGVQVMTETGTMSAKGSIVTTKCTDCACACDHFGSGQGRFR